MTYKSVYSAYDIIPYLFAEVILMKALTKWQISGFIFTGVFGVLLHFLYGWTGENVLVALFSAVNESVWEHMKLV